MLKLFSACKELQFVRSDSAVAGMISPHEEKFEFRQHQLTEGMYSVMYCIFECVAILFKSV